MKKLTMAPPMVVADKALIASVIFTVPPQGMASIGQSDSVSLDTLLREILKRLKTPFLLSVYPHRVGRRSCVAVHLTDENEKKLDILITVTGNTLWPGEAEFRNPSLKKSAETMFTRFETMSGRLAESAINPAAITNASVVPLLNPSASNMAITIGVRMSAAPSLANSAATAAPSKTIQENSHRPRPLKGVQILAMP